jgi:hypothetical protein
MAISFDTDNPRLKAKFDLAIEGLKRNVVPVCGYGRPVLIEGAEYPGIWLECGPLEGAIYGVIDPNVAVDNHRVFFHHQRADGYLPCWVWSGRVGDGQIQMVVPVAATAWEVHQSCGDVAFLNEAYESCCRWDDWLMRYRNTRGAGLCEAFCEYDTGHDNSPRWKGLPHGCPDSDARRCEPVDGLPFLAPDLSATVYGGRVAMSKMAAALGRQDDARRWQTRAEEIRRAILSRCYDGQTACFYDVDSHDRLRLIRGDALTRVLSEHVVDQDTFEDIYRRQIHNPSAFWTEFPLPSIAADDPTFVADLPLNSWGGASQALTALRAPRWFEHYDKFADLAILMRQWVKAIANGEGFFQQISPFTGRFTPSKDGYSPTMLALVDFASRLYGVRRCGQALEWNCRLPQGSSASRFRMDTPAGQAELVNEKDRSVLRLDGRELATVRGTCRVITDLVGLPASVVATHSEPQDIVLAAPTAGTLTLAPDQTAAIRM